MPHIIVFLYTNTASYLREYLVFKAISLKKWNLSKKRSYKKNKREAEQAELHERMYCICSAQYSFFAGICFWFRGILVFKADCNL